MKQELMDAITEKTKELMNSVTCSAEARAAAQTWLDAVGTQRIEEVTQAYMKELEEDIVTIQDLIALAESNQGKQIFGEEKAVQVAEHAKESIPFQLTADEFCLVTGVDIYKSNLQEDKK